MTEFADLYEETRDDVYAYVATLVDDRETAEAVTARTFERAARKAKAAQRGRPWLFALARTAALDALRRRPQQPPDDHPLTRRERELLALAYYARLSPAGIARVTGLSKAGAETALHDAETKYQEAHLATA